MTSLKTQADNENERVAKAAGVVGAATFVSRIFGFIRDVVIAWFFGAGLSSDAFFVAFRIPNLLRRLFAEGSLSVAFIPVFTETIANQGKDDAFEMARSAVRLLSVLLVFIAIAGILLSPLIIRIIAPGFTDSPEKLSITIFLTRIMFPYIFFIGMVALSMGILNVLGHFAAPALAPVFLNLSIIGSVFLLSSHMKNPVISLAVGVVIGGVLQLALQIPFLIQKGFYFWQKAKLFHPGLKKIGLLMVPMIFGAAVYQINILVGTLGHITFRNPYLNDSLTSLQVDGYRSLTNYLSYREERTGGSITLGRWLSEYVTGSVGIFAEQITFRDPQPGICPDLVPIVCLQLGTQSSTGFRTTLFRDTRDYYIDPRTGWRFGGGLDVGTPYMGGTNNFIKYYVDVIKVTPLPLDLRISLRARYGEVQALGGTQVPLNERFFVGGINTMRGFAFGRAGPVVPTTRAPFGAAKQLIFNTELIFTISAEAKLNGVLFFDYGKGFDDGEPLSIDLRPAAGLEGRWISPFGPLRVAYGINLDARTGERQGVFEFTIGTLF